MFIDVFPTNEAADPDLLAGKTVMVIDVLRATSTITTALANGASQVLPVLTIEEAQQRASKFSPNTYLLGGERKALKIPGFHLDNSPRSYGKELVENKTIIYTTSNGTKAIHRASAAKTLLLASFLNARAAARRAWEAGGDVYILCAGTRGRYSLDDAACAGMLVQYLRELQPGAQLGDLAYTLQHLYRSHRKGILQLISQASHYQRLMDMGLEADIMYCLQEDIYTLVPRYNALQGMITP
ncbi:MAG: 2-phosphosulfolactate phosphatase [Firmicutes bacterium]|nr:2-phosphosulfolactate phosphatase [Bacillota bacterium]